MAKKRVVFFSLLISVFIVILAACSGSGTTNAGNETNEKAATNKPNSNEPIKMVVPLSAGGSGDILVRTFAQVAEEHFGQKFIVENRTGGAGAIGLNFLLSQPADGRTIYYNSSSLTVSMGSGELAFKTKDLLPLATIAKDDLVLYVPEDSPYKTLDEFMEHASKNPGKLTIGGVNSFSTLHALSLQIMNEAGVELTYVPYEGSGNLVTAIMGGNLDAGVGSVNGAVPLVNDKQARVLAVTSPERLDEFPDVPTFKELGFTDVNESNVWRGFFVHPETSSATMGDLTKLFKDVTEHPAWHDYLEKSLQENYFNDSKAFSKFFNEEVKETKELFSKLER
jgi:putative tricarboxylic transport membrane protein